MTCQGKQDLAWPQKCCQKISDSCIDLDLSVENEFTHFQQVMEKPRYRNCTSATPKKIVSRVCIFGGRSGAGSRKRVEAGTPNEVHVVLLNMITSTLLNVCKALVTRCWVSHRPPPRIMILDPHCQTDNLKIIHNFGETHLKSCFYP